MNEPLNITIRETTINDIPVIHDLALKIWPNTYKEILSLKQLEYMLELIYSESSLQKQFNEGHNFLIVEEDKQPIAFADYSLLKDAIYKLHKIYVLPNQQGKGIGKMLMNDVIKKVKQKDATALVLNVNRNNKAKKVYEHLGFKVISEEDIDIGEGYFMNDFIMSYEL
ncbi:MAG TPA: GNAT family N-acetyltransferase [Parafilimonas sp.]|jgi:ribosomal protein S18 acetylase RimI-like enzyme